MYGSALNALSFQPVSDAQITVYLNNKTLHFRGSYTLEVPIYASLRITVTAPGYARYDVATTINPQPSEELRSPLMLQPLQ